VLTASLAFSTSDGRAAEPSAACAKVRFADNATTLAGCAYRLDPADPERTARGFIEAHTSQFKVPIAAAELVHVETVRGLASQHVRFRQYVSGRPVYGAFVTVHIDQQGKVRRSHSSYKTDATPRSARAAAMSADAARSIARESVRQADGTVPAGLAVRQSRQVWFPSPDRTLMLAWEVVLIADRPALDATIVVDASTGEVLARDDRLSHWVIGAGRVFLPNPIQASGDTSLTEHSAAQLINSLAVNVSLPGLEPGTALLKGRFVDASVPCLASENPDCPFIPSASDPARLYFYEVADDRFTAVNAYFAIDSAQRYLRALGFSDDRTASPFDQPNPPNNIHPSTITVYAHWNDLDNSFYRPTDDTLHFGDGGVPDAEDADVVVHEYGHAVLHAQNPTWGCSTIQPPYPWPDCEMRAMAEGFSDYLAAVVHAKDGNPAYQQAHAACIGEWDSTSYGTASPPNPTCVRRVDGTKVYPSGRIGQIHEDGEIWSRALWDIRNSIGGNVASQIILEHHFSLPPGSTMPQAAEEMLDVDADLFGSSNEAALRQAFCDRGILQGPANCTPPSNARIDIVVSKDSLLREVSPNRNEGASPLLRLKGVDADHTKTRAVLAFDLSGINAAMVKSVVLELVVAASDDQWSIHGRTLDVHPLAVDFFEGNGVNTGAVNQTLGSGSGVTWNCPADSDIGNGSTECLTPWKGGRPPPFVPFGSGRGNIPPVVQSNGMTGRVRWNVTPDVMADVPVSRWVVKKTFLDKPGTVDYWSKEGALSIDPSDAQRLRPRLVVTCVDQTPCWAP
jgi:Zn-dependent metalloprotease